VVAHEVALSLKVPLDVYIARKLGAPGNPELAIGAVSGDGTVVMDRGLARAVGADDSYIDAEAEKQKREIERRLARYRGDAPRLDVKDKVVVLVDDGLATGATALAAARGLRAARPKQLILAVPVASSEATAKLSAEVDRFVCPHVPSVFWAVGGFYQVFDQTTDEEVIQLLRDPALPAREGAAEDLASKATTA
jgi:putative phosphoribosyl transferase